MRQLRSRHDKIRSEAREHPFCLRRWQEAVLFPGGVSVTVKRNVAQDAQFYERSDLVFSTCLLPRCIFFFWSLLLFLVPRFRLGV